MKAKYSSGRLCYITDGRAAGTFMKDEVALGGIPAGLNFMSG